MSSVCLYYESTISLQSMTNQILSHRPRKKTRSAPSKPIQNINVKQFAMIVLLSLLSQQGHRIGCCFGLQSVFDAVPATNIGAFHVGKCLPWHLDQVLYLPQALKFTVCARYHEV